MIPCNKISATETSDASPGVHGKARISPTSLMMKCNLTPKNHPGFPIFANSDWAHKAKDQLSNFLVNTLCGIAAYIKQPKKPRIRMPNQERLELIAC